MRARGKKEQGHGVLVSFNWQFGKAWVRPGGKPISDHLWECLQGVTDYWLMWNISAHCEQLHSWTGGRELYTKLAGHQQRLMQQQGSS